MAIFSLAIEPWQKERGEDSERGLDLLEEVSQSTGGSEFFPRRLEDGIPALLNAVHHRWALDMAPSQAPRPGTALALVEKLGEGLNISAPAEISIP